MKYSKLLAGVLAGAAVIIVIRHLLNARIEDFDDLFFDTDFLPDAKKPKFQLSGDAEMNNWLQRPSASQMNENDAPIFT